MTGTDEYPEGVPRLSDYDVYLFRQGKHTRLYGKMGAHPVRDGGEEGTWFAVWAPNADAVSVIGDFNGWEHGRDPLRARTDGSGISEGFVAGARPGRRYEYHVVSRHGGYAVGKGDPY
ncbi:MAG: hypothetical protein QXL43_05125, partial [Methanolinea sp.]